MNMNRSKHIKRVAKTTAVIAMSLALALPPVTVLASEPVAGSAVEAEQSTYALENLHETGYAEVGFYSVEKRADNVFHIHDATKARPGVSATNPSSMFVIVGAEKALLVDAGNNRTNQEGYSGWRSDLRSIVDFLKGERTLEIAITHNHGDHTGQLTAFPEARVYMPADEYPNGDMPARYTPISEGNIISLGGGYEFEAMYLKGHTIGSMVYIDDEHRLLAVGDAMGSAHIWLFNPADVATWVAQAERFMAKVGGWEDAVLLLGHDWQRWEHREHNDILTIQFFHDMLQTGHDLMDNKIIGREYAAMQNNAPRMAYEFNGSQGANRAAYIDVPIPRGVNPVTFKADGLENDQYITLWQDVPGPSDVYMIRDGNIQSMYVIMNDEEALLIDTDNDYGGLKEYVDALIGDRTLSIYITHEHGDHVGQLGYFPAGTTVYWPADANISERTQEKLNGKNLVKVDYGDTFTVAERTFELIRMDGHTNGGSMVLDRENRLLFAGDALGTMTTTGGAWLNNGPDAALAEFTAFKENFGDAFDRAYTGHNSYWVGANYLDNIIAACQALVDQGTNATVYNIGQNRPSALQVMVIDGNVTLSDRAQYGNPGSLSYTDEFNTASTDTNQNFLLGYDIKKFEEAAKPEGYTHDYYTAALAAFELEAGKNEWNENTAAKHEAMVNIEALTNSLDSINGIQEILAQVSGLNAADHPAYAWNAITAASEAASAVCADPSALPSEIDAVYAALTEAYAELDAENTLSQIDDYGIEGSKVYVYHPPVMYNPPPMLTDILYVYAESGFETKADAWKYITETGLADLASEKQSVIAVMNPIGDAWSEQDIEVYDGFWRYLFWDPIPEEPVEESDARRAAGGRLTWGQNMYVFSEGSGATFVNQYLSQAANKIGAIVTVGGEMPEDVASPMVLPAYIAGGSQAAVDHFKALNEVDMEETIDGKPVFRNTVKDLQVVVVDETATALNAEVVRAAWDIIIGRTVRQSLDDNPWVNWDSDIIHTLTERPDFKAQNLTRINVNYNWTGQNVGTGWFEWVPNEYFEGTDGGKKYPLIVALHGSSDHPVYEAEGNGWVNVAGQERLIVAAPITESGVFVHDMIDQLIEKYPIDESRIYVVGFSLGGGGTINVTSYDHPVYGRYGRFAGMAPMSGGTFPVNGGFPEGETPDVAIPFFNTFGGRENFNQNSAANVMAFNGIVLPEGEIDEFWNLPVAEKETLQNNVRDITTTTYYNEAGVPLVKFGRGEQIAHAHFVPYGVAIYDYLKQFSRDLETGEVVYTP